MPAAQIIDLFHLDKEPDFGTLKSGGVQGVILKSSQGASERDDAFEGWLSRAVEVFTAPMVHAYHMLTGEDPVAQIENFLEASVNCPHRWLDYEDPCPSLDIAVAACHDLAQKQGKFPGLYGSDQGQLGMALLQGHFSVCPLWVARYSSTPPLHACDLWQWGEASSSLVYDSSTYLGRSSKTLAAFMAGV